MTYPGNHSLAREARDRIVTTFDQTLDLAAQGKLQEAHTGCDFILQLDPLFSPARQLKDRLQTATGAVEIEDLRILPEAPTEASRDDDIFSLSQPPAVSPVLEAAPAPAPDPAPTAPPAPTAEAPLESGEDEGTDELESALDLSMLGSTAAPPNSAPKPSIPEPLDTLARDAPPPEPAAALDAESEGRIAELLAEGQTAFEAKEYQSAIDAWSRIFLVDIDHAEASRRIELARKLKSEVERQVEEVFHEAVAHVEGGDFKSARSDFERVLEMHPSHLSAQEYLEKLDSGGFASRVEEPAPAPVAAPTTGPGTGPPMPADLAADVDGLLGTPPLEPGRPGGPPVEAPTGPPPQAKPARSSAKRIGFRPPFLYVGGAVLLLVATGVWFLWNNWDSTFPNAGDQTASTLRRPRIDPVARAVKVHDDGDTALAIAQLKRLPPSHERYAEAQALIAQWEAPEETEQAEVATPEQLAERDRLLREARDATNRREFLRAQTLMTRAAGSAALDQDAVDLQAAIEQELAPLATQIEIFRQGEWAHGLRTLWQMREANPGDLDVQRLMVDSYYNLGVRDLQRQEPLPAIDNLNEAVELAGADPEVQRLLDFAQTYEKRPVDLLYKIFVKYVPFR